MRSVIKIDFLNAVPVDGEFIRLFDPILFGLNGLITFKNQRLQAYQSTRNFNDADQTAANFALSFRLDYNVSGVFLITVDGSEVTIKVDEANAFDGWIKSDSWSPTVTISEEVLDIDLELIDIQYFESDLNPCDNVKVQLTFNKEFDLTLPTVGTSASNIIEFDYPKGFAYPIEANNGSDVFTSSQNLNMTPSKLIASNINTRISQSPNGANLVVTYLAVSFLLDIEYSLDGLTWSGSNVFGGLPDATYTVYIRDQYGCIVNKDVVIGDLVIGQETLEDYFFVAESNPFVFALENGQGLNSKLSYNEGTNVVHSALHIASDEDINTIQVKSSLPNINVEVLDCDNNLVYDGAVEKKTNNINTYDKRDATMHTVEYRGLKYINIYFEGGNIYDELNTVTGSYLDTNSIPNGYTTDRYVTFNGTTEVILSQVYNQTTNRFEIRTSAISSADILPTPIQTNTYYNVQNYDVYESTIPFTGLDGYYQIKIQVITDEGEIFAEYYSESILITDVESLPPHHVIEYSGTRNSELYFGRGLRNTIRVPYDITPTLQLSGETETYQTDTRLVSIDSTLYENRVFYFGAGDIPFTTQLVKWLSLILSYDVIFIDGDNYLKNEQGESERIGNSNGYKFVQQLKREFTFSSIGGLYNTESPIDIINPSTPTYAYMVSGNNFIDSNGLVINGN